MPITHERMTELVTAAHSIMQAFAAIKRAIRDQQADAIERLQRDGQPRWDIAFGNVATIANAAQPDAESIALIGREAALAKANRARNERAKQRMRALREDRYEPTPQPERAYIPTYSPRGPTAPQGPKSRGAHSTQSTGLQLGMQPDEFGQAPEPNPDFSGGIFGGQGQGDSLPIIGQPLPDCADIDAIMNDPHMTLDEKYAAMERLADPGESRPDDRELK